MEPRRPEWSPGGPNGAQEAQMELRRLKWNPGGPNGTQEVQMKLRRPKWNPRDPHGAQEAQMEPRRPKWSPEPEGCKPYAMLMLCYAIVQMITGQGICISTSMPGP